MTFIPNHLSRAMRRVRQGVVYPDRVEYKDGTDELCARKVRDSEAELLYELELAPAHIAIAAVDRMTGNATVTSISNSEAYAMRWAKYMFPYAARILKQHFDRGEFPAETRFASG